MPRLCRCGGALFPQPAAGHRLFAFVAGKGIGGLIGNRFCTSAFLLAFCRRAFYHKTPGKGAFAGVLRPFASGAVGQCRPHFPLCQGISLDHGRTHRSVPHRCFPHLWWPFVRWSGYVFVGGSLRCRSYCGDLPGRSGLPADLHQHQPFRALLSGCGICPRKKRTKRKQDPAAGKKLRRHLRLRPTRLPCPSKLPRPVLRCWEGCSAESGKTSTFLWANPRNRSIPKGSPFPSPAQCADGRIR